MAHPTDNEEELEEQGETPGSDVVPRSSRGTAQTPDPDAHCHCVWRLACAGTLRERSTRIIAIPIAAAGSGQEDQPSAGTEAGLGGDSIRRQSTRELRNQAQHVETDGRIQHGDQSRVSRVAYSSLPHSSWARSGCSFRRDCTSANGATPCRSSCRRRFFLSSAACSDTSSHFPLP